MDDNANGADFGNALSHAAENGQENIARLLIEEGAGVNGQGGEYDNALHAAISNKHKALVQVLLEKGADINSKGLANLWHVDSVDADVLQRAFWNWDESVARILIDYGANGGYYGNAVQEAAARSYNFETVQLLLHSGASANAQGGYYGNALQTTAAKSSYRIETVQLLIDNGTSVNAQGGYYENALQAAAAGGCADMIVQLLLDNAAPEFDNLGIVQLIIDNGSDVNARGGYFDSALQAAAAEDYKDVFRLLIEKGANVDSGLFVAPKFYSLISGNENKSDVEPGTDSESEPDDDVNPDKKEESENEEIFEKPQRSQEVSDDPDSEQ
ncbi:ankyrin repeat-containing protein [Pyronema domesticum]|nr:ankyrin repeat-containing protein [Pyronema domesticum]